MPRLTIRQHGASASIPRHPIAGNLQKPEERKANRGWTAAVARRNSQYLQRIDFERVDGTPYAVTLTLPAWQMEQVTPVVMHRLIDVMIKYLRRHGMLHFHWIIEFTARRMPHIGMRNGTGICASTSCGTTTRARSSPMSWSSGWS